MNKSRNSVSFYLRIMAVIKPILITFLCIAFVAAQDKKPKIRVLEQTVIVAPNNPYYGEWTSDIINGDTINMKTPVKQDIPENMRVRLSLKANDVVLMNRDSTLCEAMNDSEMMIKMKEHGMPKGKFSTQCPIKACEECEIVNMKASAENIPPGMPPTVFTSRTVIYMDDENAPFLTIDAKSELYYE